MSARKSPIFPIPEPQHFSDYGFDPQLDFFQVLGEARRHKRDAAAARPIDSVHFKLQKPISKDDHAHHHHKSKRSVSSSSSSCSSSHHKFKSKTRWWRNALLFFKRWAHDHHHNHHQQCDSIEDQRRAGSRPPFRGSVSGPVYLAESRSGPPGTPYRTSSRPSSGPLAGTLTPARKGDVEVPYVSLRDLNMEPPQRISTSSAIPIYLVT